MSESQAFLMCEEPYPSLLFADTPSSLQSSETQSANKAASISLAQARANAAALGHKPYRKPSIRTIDSCRSRRGSGMSDEYVYYNDGPMPPSIQVQGCSNGYPEYYQMPAPLLGPRRSSSYHEQPSLQVQTHQAMYRRASESSMYVDPNLQYLGVPGASAVMSTSRASVDSLNDIHYAAQQLRLDPSEQQMVKSEPAHDWPEKMGEERGSGNIQYDNAVGGLCGWLDEECDSWYTGGCEGREADLGLLLEEEGRGGTRGGGGGEGEGFSGWAGWGGPGAESGYA